jgi:hypothetical protein
LYLHKIRTPLMVNVTFLRSFNWCVHSLSTIFWIFCHLWSPFGSQGSQGRAMVTSVDYPIHLGLAYLFLGGGKNARFKKCVFERIHCFLCLPKISKNWNVLMLMHKRKTNNSSKMGRSRSGEHPDINFVYSWHVRILLSQRSPRKPSINPLNRRSEFRDPWVSPNCWW